MYRYLLILGVILYIIYKIASFFFKAGAASQQLRDQQRGNFNNPPQKGKKKNRSKDGEYIDYEEVK